MSEQKHSLVATLAAKNELEPGKYLAAVMRQCLPAKSSSDDAIALLMVAHRYGLDPITREIYAFRAGNGQIMPIVSVDGWARLINENQALDGIEFDDHLDDDGNLTAVTCRIWRKDRSRPVEVTEYMSECARNTEPWKRWPSRMLRHKALIQCARYAFALAGIYDEDEAGRIVEATAGGERDARLREIAGETIDVEIETDQEPEPEVIENDESEHD